MDTEILIVDDSRVLRLAMQKAAVQAGVEAKRIHQAGDGEEALGLLGDHEIDLVLLDLNLPVMDGERFLRTLRRDRRFDHVAVLLVTADSNQERLDALRDLGVDGYLQKPFEPEQLRDRVMEVLGIPR